MESPKVAEEQPTENSIYNYSKIKTEHGNWTISVDYTTTANEIYFAVDAIDSIGPDGKKVNVWQDLWGKTKQKSGKAILHFGMDLVSTPLSNIYVWGERLAIRMYDSDTKELLQESIFFKWN